MDKKASTQKKIEEILELASMNNYHIAYNIAVDILKNPDNFLDGIELSAALEEIEEKGIVIDREYDEDYLAEEPEVDLFVPSEVNIGQMSLNISNLMERLENDEIELAPEFQRNGDLWSFKKQSRLIESLMLKIPIPVFYFDASDEGQWVVIDGRQRLTAFRNYLVGIPVEDGGERIKKKLEGFQYLRDLNGLTFDELPRQYMRRIKETSIIAYTVEKGTPDAVVFNIFQRINTGGENLKPQEIRQALCHGKATQLIERMANSQEFMIATQKAISPKRMMDREYATRFLAFTELDYCTQYKGNIDNFLNQALRLVNHYDMEKIQLIEDKFKQVMLYCSKIFGRFAFRKYNESGRRGPMNKAIFELWCVCLNELTQDQLEKVLLNKELLLKGFGNLLKKEEFNLLLKAGDSHSTVRRIDMARKLMEGFL